MFDCKLNAPTHNLHTPARLDRTLVNTMAAPEPLRGSCGVLSCPADLRDFVHARSLNDAAHALDLSRWTVRRLRMGYWPGNADNIMQAWSRYKAGREVVPSWFLRRVRAGGVVRHAGGEFGAPYLASCTGQMVAVARMGSELIAQTLEIPAQRFALQAALAH